ncbi:MAG: hypothetical protein ACRDJH_06465 [Thermomicrobiales bacterium]
MIDHQDLRSDPRIQAAIDELKETISQQFPGTTYTVAIGDDPEGVYLDAIVDLDDPDAVLDLIIDRLFEIQVEEDLPLYVIPLRTPERREALARAKGDPWKPLAIPITALG